MALWKPVKGYEEQYLVSDDGQVLSLSRMIKSSYRSGVRRAMMLNAGTRGRGNTKYKFVVLSDGKGKVEHKSVHRLVAEAFIPNPDNLPEVNHKDENGLNNSVDNLEWCSHQYNIEYSKNKAVVQYYDGERIAEYKSIKVASQQTGINRKSISNVLNGWSKTAGGYEWDYKE